MRKRILWISLLITMLGMLLFSVMATQVYYNHSVSSVEDTIRVYMNFYDGSKEADETYAKELSEKMGGARVTFIDADGTVRADSTGENLSENHIGRPEVQEATAKGEGFSVRPSASIGTDMIYYCKKTDDGYVRIAVDTSSQWSIFVEAIPTIVWFFLLDILMCFIFTYLLTDFMLKPVERLAEEASRNGDLDTKYSELKPIALILNDRNRQIEQNMKEIRAEKEAVERAKQSKDELVANITHEMNTPLTSIKGFSELLLREGLSAEQKEQALLTINRQSERLSDLVASIIHYSEIDNDELPSYEVSLSALAEETIEEFLPRIREKNLTLTADIAPGVTLNSRQERITAILENLIGNAIRYNKEGGAIRISVSGARSPVLVVEDTGIGIAEENLDKIFSRFFTVDKSHSGKGGGFGLGLAVVKKLCTRFDWRITVESKEGEGTKFTVYF